MIENQKLVPNFVKELYALPSRNDNIPLTEDENGNVTEQQGGQFQYRVQRKVDGINSLKDTLSRLNLEVVPVERTKTANGKTVVYVDLQVREKGLNNRYEGLTAEERSQVDTLVANGIGFNLAKAIVKREDLNAARELDNQAAEQEAEAANQDDEENNKARQEKEISKNFIQAELDEVFEPAFELNNGVKLNFEGSLKNFKENKALTADQEKTLFAFIKHTYGSVDEYLDSIHIQLPAGTSAYFNHVHEILKELDRETLKKIYYKDLKLETTGGTKGLIENFKNKKDKISDNEKLALIRQIEKVKIDVSKLNEKTYTDCLQGDAKTLYDKIKDVQNLQNLLNRFQTSTVTKDNVQEYGKLQLTKAVLGEICKAANGEQVNNLAGQFKILDGQDNTYGDSRLRSAFQNPEERFSKIQLDLLKTEGLDVAKNIGGLNFAELNAESYPMPDATNLVTNHTESLLDNNRQYNLKFLEEGHVIKMSAHFAEKVNTTLNNPYVVNAGAAANTTQAKAQQAKYLEAAMIKVKQGEAAQLFVSTNGHWTTCSLIPVEGNKFVIICMDSMGGCGTIASDIVPKLVNFGKKLGLEIEKDGNKNFFNMSVNGQQQGACCGFASACNGFSLQKTYNALKNGGQLVKDGKFDKDAFKTALLSNIVYRKDTITLEDGQEFNGTVLYGNNKSDLSLGNFVKQFGGLALQEIASNEDMIKHLGENKVEIKRDNSNYFVDQTKLAEYVKDKKLLGNGVQPIDDQVAITYSRKRYAISKDELKQIKDVKFVKGLEKVLNGGPLDVLLDDDRKKRIFIKILKDKFADNKNPYTKKFVEDRELLKNIIHIDQAVEDKIKKVIQSALPNNAQDGAQPAAEIRPLDVTLLWLYNNMPLLGRLVELCGNEVVNCASMVDKFESTCNSWQQYNNLSDSVNTLLYKSNNQVLTR